MDAAPDDCVGGPRFEANRCAHLDSTLNAAILVAKVCLGALFLSDVAHDRHDVLGPARPAHRTYVAKSAFAPRANENNCGTT